MCRRYTRAMPVIGVCLLSGVVQACAVKWTPAPTRQVSPDTTVLGRTVRLPPTKMWPGEVRRIPLPPVASKPGTRLLYELRGGPHVAFTLSDRSQLFQPVVRGVILRAADATPPPSFAVPTGDGSPPPGAGVAPVAPQAGTPPSFCTLRVDSLAIPGDTLRAEYSVSTEARTPRKTVWRMRVVVAAPPVTASSAVGPAIHALKVHPNPCNPSTAISFRVDSPGPVAVGIFDARGRLIRRIDEHATGYKTHSIVWNGTDAGGRTVASGVYIVKVLAAREEHARKVIVLK